MPDGQDINPFWQDFINDAVVALKNFSDSIVLILGYDSPSTKLLANTFAALNQTIDKPHCIVRLVFGNVFKNLFKAVYRTARPCDFHQRFNPSCRRTSSLSTT